MKELMDEILNESRYTETEEDVMKRYFSKRFESVGTKNYVYGVDDENFVIRKDCHGNRKSVYGWHFANNVPKAFITKVNLKKSKTDLSSPKSIYVKVFKILGIDLKEWLN